MSKNTERGIGQHVGPVADGRPDDTRPRLASETPAVGPTPEKLDRDGKVPKVEVAQITLLGVPAPDLDREKATTPGRDVHLPTEVRRAAAPRSVTLDAAASTSPGHRRKTPETPRPRVSSTSAQAAPPHGQDLVPTVNARATETGEGTRGSSRSSGRRDFAETTVMDAVPEGREGRVGGSIALGITISLVVAIAIVWILRFGPHLRGFEAVIGEPPTRTPAHSLGTFRPLGEPREPRLPAAPSGTSPTPEGERAGSNATGTPAAGASTPSAAKDTAREPETAGEPPVSPATLDGSLREGHVASPSPSAATDEEGRRKTQRVRPTPSSSERAGSAGGTSSRRPPAPPAPRLGADPSLFPTSPPPVGSGSVRAMPPEPPKFEPPPPSVPAAPARPAPAKGEDKPTYDPDSPLPPAAGE